ncbi:MAG: hypothetical protein OXL68_04145 [Paracoccaceae bacterium]|nr:hypothetical protein [Paracoccaceae bacterium]
MARPEDGANFGIGRVRLESGCRPREPDAAAKTIKPAAASTVQRRPIAAQGVNREEFPDCRVTVVAYEKCRRTVNTLRIVRSWGATEDRPGVGTFSYDATR